MSLEDDDFVITDGNLLNTVDHKEHNLMVNTVKSDFLRQMFGELMMSTGLSSKWDGTSITEFKENMSRKDLMAKLTKSELLLCYSVLRTVDGE